MTSIFPFFTRTSKNHPLLSFDTIDFNIFEFEYNLFFSEHCVENITLPLHNQQHEKKQTKNHFCASVRDFTYVCLYEIEDKNDRH